MHGKMDLCLSALTLLLCLLTQVSLVFRPQMLVNAGLAFLNLSSFPPLSLNSLMAGLISVLKFLLGRTNQC